MAWTGYLYMMGEEKTHPLLFLPLLEQLGTDYIFKHVFYADTMKCLPMLKDRTNIYRFYFNEIEWEDERPNLLELLLPLIRLNPVCIELYFEEKLDLISETRLKAFYAQASTHLLELFSNMRRLYLMNIQAAKEFAVKKIPYILLAVGYGILELPNQGVIVFDADLQGDFHQPIHPVPTLSESLFQYFSVV